MTESLLPRNATPFERTLEPALGPRDAGVARLRTLALPDAIPAPQLPWLAWGEDVPHWPAQDGARRAVVAGSHRLHALIGTPAGMKAGARLTGATLRRLEGPPAKTYLGHWDPASRRAWLATHAQLRLYARRARAAATGLHLGEGHINEYPTLTDALHRSTTRCVRVEPDGRQTELTCREWSSVSAPALECAQRAPALGGFLGEPMNTPLVAARSAGRFWRLDPASQRWDVAPALVRLASPGLAPLVADAEMVAERAMRPALCAPGLPLGATHPHRSDALTRLYRRIWLRDTEASATPKRGPAYLGRTRLSLPPFFAEAWARMPPRTRHAGCLAGAGPWYPARGTAWPEMGKSLDVMNWFRAEADQIGVITRQIERVTAGATRLAGELIAGHLLLRS